MANKIICAMGVGRGEMMADILALCAKRGTVVITNIHPALETEVRMSMTDLTLMEKRWSVRSSDQPICDTTFRSCASSTVRDSSTLTGW